MSEFNCYFCKNICVEDRHHNGERMGKFTCTNHKIHVIHMLEGSDLPIRRIILYVEKNIAHYGFIFDMYKNTLRISFRGIDAPVFSILKKFCYIPSTLTPENVEEKLSFYLTFM